MDHKRSYVGVLHRTHTHYFEISSACGRNYLRLKFENVFEKSPDNLIKI